MFHTPDTETLRLCSVLSSIAFAFVFTFVGLGRKTERYCFHWAASAALYAAVLIGFTFSRGHPVLYSALLGVLALTNMLIVSGIRTFDGVRSRSWMLIPGGVAMGAHLLPGWIGGAAPWVGTATHVCDTLSIAGSAAITGCACLFSGPNEQALRATNDAGHGRSRGRRLAGCAMLAYLPGYAITLTGYLWTIPDLNLLALIPMLSDQLLLAILNLGLLAMAAERAQQGLRAAALRDPLTGVWNRAGFEVHARPLIEPGATVLVLDLDHFKGINDRYGHLAGDSVLKAVAGLAGAEVESLGGEFGRLGGDEFLAVLPAWRAPYAQACALQIQEACRRYTSDIPEWTISLGLATVQQGDSAWRDAFLRADRALYRAKLDGRNTLSE